MTRSPPCFACRWAPSSRGSPGHARRSRSTCSGIRIFFPPRRMPMPSEPRIPAEPTLEELSAYLDHELDSATQARVADHVGGCDERRARLHGLRETADGIAGSPMGAAARKFS